MGTMTIPGAQCERARQWASLDVDGELSELEQALFAAHLQRCADCRAFAAGVRAVGSALRSAPLERPVRPLSVRPLRRTRSLRILQASAAAAVVATAGLGAMVVDVFHSTSVTAAPRIQRVSAIGDESPSVTRELRRTYLLASFRRSTAHVLFP
jgi:predicted anti-sigma-YlaC factor YlaD